MNVSSLELKIKNLTVSSGVYLMKDMSGEILYVGKAKNLKNRVGSYFQASNTRSPRVQLLVTKICDFELVLTDNEVEALLLEFNLIKKYKPRFNVRLKDDKSYPFIRVDSEHPFPRLEYIRKVKKDGARYFGPYVSAYQVRELLGWAKKAFGLRDCSDNEFRNRSRPCILHEMGQCTAPCVQLITEGDYQQRIAQVLQLLDGKTDSLIRELSEKMQDASEKELFELAAELRDRINQVEALNQDQKIEDPESSKNIDIIHFARLRTFAAVVVMVVRDGRTVGVLQFPFDDIDPMLADPAFGLEFLVQYYLKRFEEAPSLLPEEILLPQLFEIKNEPETLSSIWEQIKILQCAIGKNRDFRVPKRGKAVELLEMVKKTADFHLQELVARTASTVEDLIDVQKRLNLKKFPQRIECYDISHFQGEGTVASRVVFRDGRPEKSLYRHYHVREVTGPDDFASLREVLQRRFEGKDPLPDLVVIDGGKGQLAQAEMIFMELGITGVDLVSLAKARTKRSFRSVKVEASLERVFKPGQKNPIMLKPGSGAYRIMTQARDESHRFAITFHRQVRDRER